MFQFNPKADRASHGARDLTVVNDGASRAILVSKVRLNAWVPAFLKGWGGAAFNPDPSTRRPVFL